MADNLTFEQRSRTMARIKSRDTKPELHLRKALWANGHRGYRVDRRDLPGRPDIIWPRSHLAVFVDGAFWHGHPPAFKKGKSGDYWDAKIARNMKRDQQANAALSQMGWRVLRFWDFEVRRELDRVIHAIEQVLASADPTSE
jgi:DNA mismatch endonuclease, patch repair protein